MAGRKKDTDDADDGETVVRLVPNAKNAAGNALRSFVERMERLVEQKQAIAGEISACRNEAKGAGFEPKALTQILKERRINPEELREFRDLCNTYRTALGHLADTPLGEAATPKRGRQATRDTAPGFDEAAPIH